MRILTGTVGSMCLARTLYLKSSFEVVLRAHLSGNSASLGWPKLASGIRMRRLPKLNLLKEVLA